MIGGGGFGKIYKVKRKSDGMFLALKFVEPKNPDEKQMIKNEVGIMMSCTENDAILRCIEAYDFKKRVWIFRELMDGGALT